MSSITSIVSALIGFASGGWGSLAAIVVLLGAGIFLWFKYKKSIQDAASGKTQDQAAVDVSGKIINNQQQGEQVKIDDAANEKAKQDAANGSSRP